MSNTWNDLTITEVNNLIPQNIDRSRASAADVITELFNAAQHLNAALVDVAANAPVEVASAIADSAFQRVSANIETVASIIESRSSFSTESFPADAIPDELEAVPTTPDAE